MKMPKPLLTKDENSITKKKKGSYCTLEFIKDLMSELQKQPEALAKFFPERVKKLNNRALSLLWNYNKDYIQTIISRITYGKAPNFRFKPTRLNTLKKIVSERFRVRALGLLKIIENYKHSDMTTIEFINEFKKELGRTSGLIKVTKKELSLLFGKSIDYILSIIASLKDPMNNDYKPNFKFSIEILEELKQNFEIEKYSLLNFLKVIEEFEKLNPDIPTYTHMQYTISNIRAFHDIFNDAKAAYWFGFLCADGYVNDVKYLISLELTKKDRRSTEKFADFVGFDRSRIRDTTQFKKDKDGKIDIYYKSIVAFIAKPMVNKLKELGIFGSKSERKSVPNFIKEVIKLAKEEVEKHDLNIHWSKTKYGKIAHSWLLGFYDGDGQHKNGYSALIFSSNEVFLNEIKELFESPNEVHTTVEPGTEISVLGKKTISIGFYKLTLGPEVFKRMLLSYKHSMVRKRP